MATRTRRYYFARIRPVHQGVVGPEEILQVTAQGSILSRRCDQQYATRWGMVWAASAEEGRAKFQRGEVVFWSS